VSIPAANVGRLALVRLDRIGDFLLWVGAARFYRQHFRNAEIVLFGNAAIADLARAMPHWDRFAAVHVPEAGAPALADAGPPPGQFDLVVNLQYSRTFAHDRFVAALPARRAVAADVRGPNMTPAEFAESSALYSDLLELTPAPMHELARNFEILNAITGGGHAPELEPLAPLLGPRHPGLPPRYVAVFPGGSWAKKAYPWPRLVALCRMLQQRFGIVSVLCGGPADKVAAANIDRNAQGATIDLTGSLDLRESLAVIAGAELVVANDSMAAHAANHLRRPSVCLLGGGYNRPDPAGGRSSGRFFPYPEDLVPADLQIVLEYPMPCAGCSYLCKYDAVARDVIPCLDYIPLPALLEAADRSLSEGFLRGARGVIHVGANVGQERDLYARHGLAVLWVEPVPAVFETLTRNIAGLPGQQAACALVTDRDGEPTVLHVANNEGASSSILALGRHREIWPEVEFVEDIPLSSTTLPTLLRKLGRAAGDFDVLVLDTQGSEGLVLAGAQPLLAHLAWIRTEAADFEAYVGCTTVVRLQAFLEPLGFRLRQQRKFAEAPDGGAYFDLLFGRAATA
jgi:FkbM family methyltransferase